MSNIVIIHGEILLYNNIICFLFVESLWLLYGVDKIIRNLAPKCIFGFQSSFISCNNFIVLMYHVSVLSTHLYPFIVSQNEDIIPQR